MIACRQLNNAREIKAYLHRTRMTILAELREAPLTVSQLGARLGVHPANLSRHMRRLEEAGLIERTSPVGGVEKHYLATAMTFEVAPDASAHAAGHAIALSMVKSDLAVASARLANNNTDIITALLARALISQGAAKHFARELGALVDRFKAAEEEAGCAYHLNVSLYPGGAWDGPTGPIKLTNNKVEED